MGRSGHSGSRPVPGFKYLTNPFRVLLPGANGHQCSGNVADHVVQKCIGLHVNYDELALSGYVD